LRTGLAGHSCRDIYTIGRDAERWGRWGRWERWERWWSGDRVASAADVVHGIIIIIIRNGMERKPGRGRIFLPTAVDLARIRLKAARLQRQKEHGNRTDNDTTETHKRVQPPITSPLADARQLNAVCSHAEEMPS
jgi:hypothetical protein